MARGGQPKVTQTLIDRRPSQAVDLGSALANRKTPEIIIGLVGPVSSGVTKTAELIETLIAKRYAYEARRMKLSDLVRDNRDFVNDKDPVPSSGSARITRLQLIGTKLREQFGGGYLAEKAIEKVAVERGETGYADSTLSVPKPRRVVHIIDSIKNPEEAHVFRAVYGSAFWLVGVFAPRTLRVARLREQFGNEAAAVQIVDRDEHEGPAHGQDVREAFYESDYFLKNPYNTLAQLEPSVERLLKAIFEDEIVTPNEDERGMSSAKQNAAASACLSRQVGAAIVAPNGNQIGAGWNEVPRFGGGVYGNHPAKVDGRCFAYKGKNCRNDEQKTRLLEEVLSELKPYLNTSASKEALFAALNKTGIRSLIEFSRAVHAEMAAIVDVARSGRGSVSDATMYVTTFLCHNCARHIIASGIKRVVYIEPYPKSLAIELHDDALSDLSRDSDGASDKVVVEPFEGVGPQRYFSVFLMRDERKFGGVLKPRVPTEVLPADAESLDAFTTLEKRVLDHLKSVEPNRAGGSNG